MFHQIFYLREKLCVIFCEIKKVRVGKKVQKLKQNDVLKIALDHQIYTLMRTQNLYDSNDLIHPLKDVVVFFNLYVY